MILGACRAPVHDKMSHVGKKRKVDRSGQDRLYFDSYTDVTIHEEMIADHVRTNTYRMAILRNSELIRGRWSWTWGPDRRAQHVLCSRPERRRCSRWRRVRSPNRRNIVQQNNMEDRIEVEVIVSEWMGYALLHESMLNSVLFARDKWLKPGGLILRTKPSSTSPHQRPGGGGPAAVLTHWKQAVLYLDDAVCMYPSEDSGRHICIHVDYTIGEEKRQSKSSPSRTGAVKATRSEAFKDTVETAETR
uniref:Protein arginine N-methyltransferase 6 n=1 Tax=Labrus bergylta TaxID=56723 RepID=A0A3Q3L4W6_9LABR